MTTNRIGMKFLIVAATAGALVAGSGAGAMAAPPVAKPAKKASATVVLKSVDIKGHSALDFYAATLPTLKVTARVKDPGRAPTSEGLTVTLAKYTKKVKGMRVGESTVQVPLKWVKGGTSKYFSGSVTFDAAQALGFQNDLTEAKKSLYLCLSDVEGVDVTVTRSTKMKKRLDNGKGVVAVGDCVRLVYRAPSPTPADPSTPPADSTTPPTVTPPGAGSPTTTSPTTSVPGADSTTTTTPPAGSTTPTTTPGKSAVALVRAIDRGNTLYVNVNPNKGKGYWRFQVQRKKGVDTWKTLSTYRTKGTKETRKLDLKKGTYRVVVHAKYGHQGATSAEVSLKR